MNISSVSGASGFASSPATQNSTLKALERQKAVLEEQKERVKQSDIDSKLKQETLRALDEQIAEIERQIWEQKTEKLQAKGAENSSTSASAADPSGAGTNKTGSGDKADSVNSKHMISAASEYSDLKTMKRVRTDLQGKLRLATSSGENPEAGAGIRANIQKLETGMAEKSNKINKDLEKAVEEVKDAKTPADEIQETVDSDNTTKENLTSEKADKSENVNPEANPEILPIGSYIDIWA